MKTKFNFIVAVLLFAGLFSCGEEKTVGDAKPDFILGLDSLDAIVKDVAKAKEMTGKIIQTTGKVNGMSSVKIKNGAEGSGTFFLQSTTGPGSLRCDFATTIEESDPMGKEYTIKGEFRYNSADDYRLARCVIVK